MKSSNVKLSKWQCFFIMYALFRGGYGLILPHKIAQFGLGGIGLILINASLAGAIIVLGEKIERSKVWRAGYCIVLYGSLLIGICTWQEMLNSEILIYTPRWIALGVLMSGILYLCMSGIETIGRLAQVITLPLVLAILFIFLCGAENMRLLNLLLPQGNVIDYLQSIPLCWPLFVSAWAWSYLKERTQGNNRIALWALAGGTVTILAEYVAVMFAFGAYMEHFYWNMIELSAIARVDGWFARLESIDICIWLIFSVLYGGIVLKGIWDIYGKTGKLVLTGSIYLLAVWIDNLVLLQQLTIVYSWLGLSLTVVLLAASLRKRSRQ